MEDIENQIKNYQTKIADLNKKYKENSNNSSEQLIINKQIIENYTFIDTLLKIKASLDNKTELNNNNKNENIEHNYEEEKHKNILNKEEEKDLKNKKKNLHKTKHKNNKNINNNEKKLINEEDQKIKPTKINDILTDININIDNDKSFEYYFNDDDLNTKFLKDKSSKNFIYFTCSKNRNGCKGLIKYNKEDKKFYLMYKCNKEIKHDTSSFNEFYNEFINDNLNKYNMKYTKFQKFYIRSLFKSNQSNTNVNVKNAFKIKFKFTLDLTNEEINYEKHLAFGTNNNLSILELCNKINDNDIKVNIHTQDIFYDYKNKKNKISKREEIIIVVTTEQMEKRLKNPNISDYFIDTTYTIIPKGIKSYKLIAISGVENELIKSNLNALNINQI